MFFLPIRLADPHVTYARFSVSVHRHGEPRRALSRLYPVAVDEISATVLRRVEDAKHIANRNFLKITKPWKICGLVRGQDHRAAARRLAIISELTFA